VCVCVFWLFIYTTMAFWGPKNEYFENGFQSASFEKDTVIVTVHKNVNL